MFMFLENYKFNQLSSKNYKKLILKYSIWGIIIYLNCLTVGLSL